MNDRTSEERSSPQESSAGEQVLEGVGVAPGIAVGFAYCYCTDTPDVDQTLISPEEVESEIDLFEEALARAREEIEKIRSVAEGQLDSDGEAIFAAQELMLRDEEMVQSVRQVIRDEHATAGRALSRVLRDHRRRIADSDDEYLRERANDLMELETRLLRALEQGKAAATVEPNSVVVADRLTAADVIRFSRQGVRGCVTARGGRTSHVSILARALGLPTIVGVEAVTDVVANQDRVLLDGFRGRLFARPTEDTIEQYDRRRRVQPASLAEETSLEAPTHTSDGRRITLLANVDFPETLDTLAEHGAEGIGLLRTEMMFFGAHDAPLTEESQQDVYRHAAVVSGEHGATIRLFDLGGDKLLPSSHSEENPFLGWRGMRVLLDRTDELLRPQLRALLRANAHGPLRVLLPMVTQLDEVRRVRAVLGEEADRLAGDGVQHDPDLPLGAMVEVPAVALQAEAFAEVVDFLSIGTNDLTQYVLAVDRGNDRVAAQFDALHPAVLTLVQQTLAAGRRADIPVSICGEIASDMQAVPILVGLGLDRLSAPPSYLPVLKQVISEIAFKEAERLAQTACAASDAQTVRDRARSWMAEHIDAESPLHSLSSEEVSTAGDRSTRA